VPDDAYQSITCLACRQSHFVNPTTCKVLGEDQDEWARAAIPVYRIYVLSAPDNKIEGTHTVFCDSDSEAISRAAEYLEGEHLVEIRQSERIVRRLRPEGER
jgi:hypothetical protein